MASYTPKGKAHWILALLAERGPTSRDDLYAVAHYDLMESSSKRVRYVIAALVTDGLVVHRQWRDELTETGREALQVLDAGRTWTTEPVQPGARVFARAEAA